MSRTANEKICYADCFSGISGDMFLGALLHCGLDREFLLSTIDRLDLEEIEFSVITEQKSSISCCRVSIRSRRKQELRTLPVILNRLEKSGLDDTICSKAAAVFTAIAEAEARIHNMPVEKVHFHEIGAVDTIIDVVGTLAGLHHLSVSSLYASPLPMGRGFINCAHGKIPLPAPAVTELLQKIPVYGVNIDRELVTPTGAALLKVLADDFGPMPPMTISTTGYGGGSHILPGDQPNLLRLVIGYAEQVKECQEVLIIETNLDDWNPETFPFLCEKLFAGKALDVSLTPILMKKGRPGYCLQVICHPADGPGLKNTILMETSSIGLRFRKESRQTMPRETVSVATGWGPVKAKKVEGPAGPVVYPEYEECRKIALENNVTLREVYDSVRCGKENIL
ncbi:nickel pincer cofactor biosynthesis protein LarC [Desulfomarina sp.]